MLSKKLLVLALAAPLLFTACKKEKRPDGMPELYPVTAKILQDGQPLAEANVAFIPTDPANAAWAAGGNTTDDGTVKLMTYGFPGAPAGAYKVTVMKVEMLNHPTNHEEYEKFQAEGLEEENFDLVERQYADMSTTPLTADIQASKDNPVLEFDVGSAVHISRKDMMR